MCEVLSASWQRNLSCEFIVNVSKQLAEGSWSLCDDDSYRVQLECKRGEESRSCATEALGEATVLEELDTERDCLKLTVSRKKYLHRTTVGTVCIHLSSIPLLVGSRQQLELPLITNTKSPSMGSARSLSVARLHLDVQFREDVLGDILYLLPSELAWKVASFLDVRSIARAMQVSHEWSRIFSDDALWHQSYRECFPRVSVVSLDKDTWRSRLQYARGFYSFAAAVSAASPSDRLILQPASYQAGFAIRTFITLTGDQGKDDEAIHLDGRGRAVALFWSKAGGCVEDARFTFSNCQDALYFGSPEGPVRIQRCSLAASPSSAPSTSILHFNRSQAKLVVSNCIISGGSYACIIFRHSRGLLQNCRVYGSGGSGVLVTRASSPTLRGNVIENCQIGVRYLAGATGLLDTSSVLHCSKSGVNVSGESDVTISGTLVRQCVKSGLVVKGRGRATAVNNIISDNCGVGVVVSAEGRLYIAQTVIQSQHSAGILVENGSHARVECCQVQGNRLAGIEVRADGKVTAKNCEVSTNGTAGLYAHSGGRVLMEHCELWGHVRTCIRVLNSSTITVLRYNSIQNNESNAIFVSKGATAVVDRNVLSCNARGIHVVGCCEGSFIVRNLIKSNSRAGIVLSSGGFATFQENVIADNLHGNVLIRTSSYPRFIGNRLSGGGAPCVSVHTGGGLFLRNSIRTCCLSAFVLVNSSCIFQENTVERCGGSDLLQTAVSRRWYAAVHQRGSLGSQLSLSARCLHD